MNLTAPARRLGLLGVALALTLTSAAWLFFGTRADEAPTAAPAARPGASAVAPTAVAPKAVAPKAVAPKTVAAASGDATPSPAAANAPQAAAPADAAPIDTTPAVVTVEREVFGYASNGRRDPFRALISTSVIRPLPSELRLVAVVFDPRGAGSVAILRDLTTKSQHRVRAGQLLGRMRVAQIRRKDVVFTIEELGFSRQEILGLQDSTATRLP